jgi:hypothetical protein
MFSDDKRKYNKKLTHGKNRYYLIGDKKPRKQSAKIVWPY